MKGMEKEMNKGKMKIYGKVIMKTALVIGLCMVIDTAMAGITDAQIKAASKTWVSTISDWSPGVVGGGMALAAIMFFLNKYAYGIGAIAGTAFMYASKSYMGDGQAALIDMAKALFG